MVFGPKIGYNRAYLIIYREIIGIFLSTSPLFYLKYYMKYIPICVIIIKTHTNNTKEDSFLEIFKYWIWSYLQVHVFTIILKVFKGGERKKKTNIIIFDQLILIYRANIGKRAILCQNIGIIGHFRKDRDFIGNIGPLEGLQ